MILSILNAIAALPAIFKSIKGLVAFLEYQFGRKWMDVILEVGEAFEKLEKADTQEKKFEAAKSIQAVIRRGRAQFK